jgi:predicted SprT family Zn-dependent metalloprotease
MDTILHEMVHQWQHSKGLNHNEHDETFTQWLPKIKEVTGIELQDTWTDCDGEVG